MAQAPVDPRPRRNSDASQRSCATQFSWKHMIHPERRYNEGPITNFLGDFQRWDRLLCSPAEDTHLAGGLYSDNSTCYAPSIPSMTAGSMSAPSVSNTSSTTVYNSQMYNFSFDSTGNLFTRRHGAGVPAAVYTGVPAEGMCKCLFAFDGCTEMYTRESWKSHVNKHLSNATPPQSCTCSICDFKVENDIPELAWGRFLEHILDEILIGKHTEAIRPDGHFLEFCCENGIISELTRDRFEGLQTSPEPYQYRPSVCVREQTPRTMVEDAMIARVEYPSSWDDNVPAVQRVIERDIVSSRRSPRGPRTPSGRWAQDRQNPPPRGGDQE